MRAVERVLSTVLALALLALGVLIPVEVIRAFAGGTGQLVLPYQPVASFLRDNPWSAAAVVALSVAVAVVGLLLVLVALTRRRRRLLAVRTDSEPVTAGVSRRSLARALANSTTELPGITGAAATVQRKRATVEAVTPVPESDGLSDRVQQRARATMESLALERPLPLRVRVSQRGGNR